VSARLFQAETEIPEIKKCQASQAPHAQWFQYSAKLWSNMLLKSRGISRLIQPKELNQL
jgi:hypothetical protein